MATSEPVQIRLGGYAPRDSTHGRALDRIAADLREQFGDRVEVAIDYNILDSGRQVQDLLTEVEQGTMTLCYFSSSYLADRVPEIGIIDLPYLFHSLEHAHTCLDGELGARLSEKMRAATGFVPLGFWDNGFRHLSNRDRDIRSPEDCRNLVVRLQPNWAHEQFFRALGTEPISTDLRDGIARLRAGDMDAQENPFANFVAYGIHEVHKHVSLTAHVYGARSILGSAKQFEDLPDDVVEALTVSVRGAVLQQRAEAQRKEIELQQMLEESGTTILELTDEELASFRAVARPVLDAAVAEFGRELFDLIES